MSHSCFKYELKGIFEAATHWVCAVIFLIPPPHFYSGFNVTAPLLYGACSHHNSQNLHPSPTPLYPCPPLLCISLTRRGPTASAPTPVHHFTLTVPTLETCWLTAALQRSARCLAFMVIICSGSCAVETEGEREWVSGSRLCCGANLDDWPWNASWNGLPCVPLKWPVPGSVM